MLCFILSLTAVVVTSAGVEARAAAMVPAIRQFADDYETVMVDVIASERGLKELSINVVPRR